MGQGRGWGEGEWSGHRGGHRPGEAGWWIVRVGVEGQGRSAPDAPDGAEQGVAGVVERVGGLKVTDGVGDGVELVEGARASGRRLHLTPQVRLARSRGVPCVALGGGSFVASRIMCGFAPPCVRRIGSTTPHLVDQARDVVRRIRCFHRRQALAVEHTRFLLVEALFLAAHCKRPAVVRRRCPLPEPPRYRGCSALRTRGAIRAPCPELS